MTETNYKLTLTSLEIKDPAVFTQTYTTATCATDSYRFEMATKTQTKKDMGLTRTVHHGQSTANIALNKSSIVPFFQLTSEKASEVINIGKIIIDITSDVDISSDKILQLVGTIQSATTLTLGNSNSTISESSDKPSNTTLLGVDSDIYKSNFYLNNTNTNTQKWIIDLNKFFKSDAATTASYIALGLKLSSTHAACKFKIDAYTEVITV